MANGGTNWWDEGQEELRRQRKGVQFQAIKEALGEGVRIYPDDDDPETTEYLYRERTILTRTSDAPEVLRELELGDADKRDGVPVDGVTTITIPVRSQWADHERVFALLDNQYGPGFAMPDSAIHITGTGGGCPATEPVPWPGADPLPAQSPTSKADAGKGKTVIVLDSGVRATVVNAHAWLKDVAGTAENPGQVGHIYEGHGTFIAGVMRTMAPRVSVEIRSFDYKHGALLESDLAPKLRDAIEAHPDIINMSAGLMTRNNQPPIALAVLCEKLRDPQCKTVLVAAAGNDMSMDPFFPAACPGVVSVGALDGSGKLAGYSNRGPHVQVYAQGSDIVNAFPKGTHNYGEPPYGPGAHNHFDNGMASWDGTSFSTPMVAGLIAARMTTHNQTAKDAWAFLLARAATQPGSDSGPRLFPGDEV